MQELTHSQRAQMKSLQSLNRMLRLIPQTNNRPLLLRTGGHRVLNRWSLFSSG